MKTKLYLPIISLLAMSVFAFISCDDSDSDTTKPVIELSEPEEGARTENWRRARSTF